MSREDKPVSVSDQDVINALENEYAGEPVVVEPCSHPGCLHHVTHPCEGCGRIGGKPVAAQKGKPLWIAADWAIDTSVGCPKCSVIHDEIATALFQLILSSHSDHASPCARCGALEEWNATYEEVSRDTVAELQTRCAKLTKEFGEEYRGESYSALQTKITELESALKKWAVWGPNAELQTKTIEQAAEIAALQKTIDEEAKDSGAVIIENERLKTKLAAAEAVIETANTALNDPYRCSRDESRLLAIAAITAYQKGEEA